MTKRPRLMLALTLALIAGWFLRIALDQWRDTIGAIGTPIAVAVLLLLFMLANKESQE